MNGELIFCFFYGGVIIFIGCFSGIVIGKQFDQAPGQVNKGKKVGQ